MYELIKKLLQFSFEYTESTVFQLKKFCENPAKSEEIAIFIEKAHILFLSSF